MLSSRKTFSQFCRIHYWACSIIACTLVAGSLVILIGTPIGLDGPLLDVLIKTRAIVFPRDISPAKSPVAVIALDVRSLNEPELAPYPRTLLAPVWATLLDAVMKAGAQAVGFDLVFAYSANRFSPNFDRPFLEMLDRHRARVVLGRSMTTLPAPPFLGALRSSQDAMGVVDLPADWDGTYRRIPTHFLSNNKNVAIPSIAAALLRRANAPGLPDNLLVAPRQHLERIPTYAVVDVLRCATQAPEALRQAFQNKIILIGSTIREEDRRRTAGIYLSAPSMDEPPLHPCGLRQLGASDPDSSTVPGVFLHAAAIEAVVTDRVTTTAPTAAMAMLAMVITAGIAAVSLRVTPWMAGITSVGVMVVLMAVGTSFLEKDIWIPIALPLVILMATCLITYVIRFLVEERRKRTIQQELIFLGGLPKKMVEQMASGEIPLKLGGEEATVTVMFADLSGFTTLSTQIPPNMLVTRTTQYLASIVHQIEATGGWVNQFLGDCVMAIWGAPILDSNHALNAVRAACAAVAQIDRIRAEGEGRGEGGFRVKIGINSGPAMVGKIGTFMRGSYTAYGQTVNVASRLESVPGLYYCGIVMGPQTAELVQDTFLLRELDTIQVKGVELPITVFEPVGEQPGTSAQRELTTRYAEALSHYRTRRFKEALVLWNVLACSHHEPRSSQSSPDGFRNPSAMMAERSRAYTIHPPPSSWNGTWVLTSK